MSIQHRSNTGKGRSHAFRALARGALVLAGTFLLTSCGCGPRPQPSDVLRPPPPARIQPQPAPRQKPASFSPNTNMPRGREAHICGGCNPPSFSPSRDVVRIEDPRVHWESDGHRGGPEDDHLFYRGMERPMRRLIDMVDAAGGSLTVHDAYRPSGVHKASSLHREGRAVDLTCAGITLEELAKLSWLAGFDWVYYERRRGAGGHVHASVKR